MSTRRLLAAVAIALWIGAVHADPLPVPCVSLVVKDDPTPPAEPKKRFFKLRSGTRLVTTGRIVPPPPGSAGDPTLGGATVTVFNTGGTPQAVTHVLPAARWSLIGSTANFKGYQFHDDTPADGPIVRVFVKPDKIFVAGGKSGWSYALGTAPQGSVAARLALGADEGWCVEAPAKAPASVYDTPARFVGAKDALPAACSPTP
jgi:hypothetical protein